MALLKTQALTKQYPGVRALDGVDFELQAGEVHVLFGENGAGKSTLISILAGAARQSSGKIVLRGRPVHFRSVREARANGISAVFQEFSLVPELTIAENLLLGHEPRHGILIDRRAMGREARRILDQIGFAMDPARRIGDLSRAEQQMVEIAKSLRSHAQVLILDEPTASLTDRETQQLFDLVERLKRQGVGIVYISHRMQEIDSIADRITVLRDGRKIDTLAADHVSHDRLIELMTGRDIQQLYPKIRFDPGEKVLEIDALSTAGGVRNASLHVRRGEVVGIAGLVGSGKSEILRAAYGLERVTGGKVHFLGKEVTGATPAQMLKAGIFYLPPDRKTEGLVLNFSSDDNISLPIVGTLLRHPLGLLKLGAKNKTTRQAAERVELEARNGPRAVGLLSGGNQQKVMFAKGLTQDAVLYVFDEPTVGVDVGTRAALYRLIQQLCEAGAAVVVISSDLPEVLHLSHRAYVMRAGEIAGELEGSAITEASVLSLFFPCSPETCQ